MSVFLKGVDMPESCSECPCCHEVQMDMRGNLYEYFCSADDNIPTIENITNGRLNSCQAVSVPDKHGRLIDADAFMKVVEENDYVLVAEHNTTDRGMFTIGIQQAIEEAPTIIEAEEEQ